MSVEDINTAFQKLKTKSEENEDTITNLGDYSHFTPLILPVTNGIKRRKSVLTPLLSMTT